MKNTSDYKSRFRILKGGKISLVVSALLVGAGLVSTTEADCLTNITIDNSTSMQTLSMCADTNVTVAGNLVVSDYYAAQISGDYFATVVNDGNISLHNSNNNYGNNPAVIVTSSSFNVTNNGDINSTGDYYAQGIQSYSNYSNSSNSSITNNGNINVVAGSGYGMGIQNDSYYGNGVSILNNGNINVSGDGAYGIYTQGEDSSVTNALGGKITVNGNNWARAIESYNYWKVYNTFF